MITLPWPLQTGKTDHFLDGSPSQSPAEAAQRHQHQLGMFGGIQDMAKVVGQRIALIGQKALHKNLLSFRPSIGVDSV